MPEEKIKQWLKRFKQKHRSDKKFEEWLNK